MQAEIAFLSHTGKVRQKNEDNLLVLGSYLPLTHDISEPEEQSCLLNAPRLLGVFDGMGGYSAGEYASYQTALAAKKYASQLGTEPGERMKQICMEANDRVCRQMQTTKNRMGATASMLCLQESSCTVCNIGDSPIFLLRDHQLMPIHQEHTERESYEMITGKKADPKKKFRLTQNIGVFPEEMQIEPYVNELETQPGDLLLICSDGLTDMVDQQRLLQLLDSGETPKQIISNCLSESLANGGKDNITIVCIRLEADAQTQKNKSKWPAVLAGILVLAVIVGGVMFLRKAHAKKQTDQQTTVSETETSTAAELTTQTAEPPVSTETEPISETLPVIEAEQEDATATNDRT